MATPVLPPFELPDRCFIEPGHEFRGLMGGRYIVKRKLGEGSFGIVFLVEGRDTPWDAQPRQYALKLLKLWEVAYQKAKQDIHARFVREFMITQLKHEHLVPSFDCGTLLSNPWFVMEFCERGSLGDPQNSLAQSRITQVNAVARQVLLGLKALHDKGLVHRDIKPQNILKTADGKIKLTDFGIAGDKNNRMTVSNLLGETKSVFGTYAYIAPEQTNNKIAYKALDPIADIFSFGVTMFELLVGQEQYPFPPPLMSQAALADYQKNKQLGRWTKLDESKHTLPGDWYEIIKKSIEPDYKKRRFKSVDEILSLIGPYSLTPKPLAYDVIRNDLLLLVTYGAQTGKVYNLSDLAGRDRRSAIITLGRRDTSINNMIEVVEEDPVYISRRHCTIEKRSMGGRQLWWIRDGQQVGSQWQRSLNNTYVNSVEVDQVGQELNVGDVIAIGDTRLMLTVD
jgi:serine/threonine protein kinase